MILNLTPTAMHWLENSRLPISIDNRFNTSAYKGRWVVMVNPMNGTGPKFFIHEHLAKAIEEAMVAFPYEPQAPQATQAQV